MSSTAHLTSERQINLGDIRIDSGLLAISGPLGARIIEPRVMQVLVILAGTVGRPVTRDDLVIACWAGRAVSEDALNRAMAKLRVALADVSQAARVETIRGVGYRLVLAGAPSPSPDIVPAIDLETRALGAMFEGTASGTATAIHYLKQAVSERPAEASVWGSLAMAYVLNLPFAGDRLLNVVADARQAASRAQQLQSGEGRSLAALASLEPTYGAWAAKDRMLREMLARAPAGTAPLLFQRVLYLASVGRISETLEMVTALATAAPLIPWIQSARSHALAACGAGDEALWAARQAQQRWPCNRLCWFTYFHLSLHFGQVSETLALLEQGPIDEVSRDEFAFAKDVAHARAAPSLARPEAMIAQFEQGFTNRQSPVEQAVLAAALLHMPDQAIRLLCRLYSEPFDDGRGSIAFPKIGLLGPEERNTAILFLAPLHEVHTRSGFLKLIQLTGLPMLGGMGQAEAYD